MMYSPFVVIWTCAGLPRAGGEAGRGLVVFSRLKRDYIGVAMLVVVQIRVDVCLVLFLCIVPRPNSVGECVMYDGDFEGFPSISDLGGAGVNQSNQSSSPANKGRSHSPNGSCNGRQPRIIGPILFALGDEDAKITMSEQMAQTP
eukprot:scaffold549_cov117-Isochrysis_galbana.AAC.18